MVFLILLCLISPPSIQEINRGERVEFRIPVDSDVIIVSVPQKQINRGRRRVKDILMRFCMDGERKEKIMRNYSFMVRGEQFVTKARSQSEALSHARSWLKLTDVSY